MIAANVPNLDLRMLAIVGFSARSATQCAVRQGFEVTAVDMCADRDLICQCQKHYRLDDPKWPDVLNAMYPGVPLLLTGGMEHRTQWVDRCHLIANRGGPDGKQLSAMRSLANWERWAALSDVGWPTTFRKIQDINSFPDHLSDGDWLLKPFQSAGGIGTIGLTNSIPLSQHFIQNPNKAYIQRRLPGVSIGITFLSCEFGSALVGATAAWSPDSNSLPAMHYAYRGSYGPISLTEEQIEKLQYFAGIVGRESGLLGLWQADFLMHRGSLTLLEINPRWSASMDILDVCLNIRLVELHYECISKILSQAAFEQLAREGCKRAKKPIETMLGKLIVYAQHTFTVSHAQSDHWWANRWESDMKTLNNRSRFADIPDAGTVVEKGSPILTVLASGRSHESIFSNLQTAKSEVEASWTENKL